MCLYFKRQLKRNQGLYVAYVLLKQWESTGANHAHRLLAGRIDLGILAVIESFPGCAADVRRHVYDQQRL